MKYRFNKRLLSLLMIFMMLFGNLSQVLAVEANVPNRSVSSESGEILSSEYTADPADTSSLGLKEADASLLNKGVDASLGLTKYSETNSAEEAEYYDYVLSVAEELTTNAGVVGLDNVSDNETVRVFVWLQQLPEALERVYAENNMSVNGYSAVKADAVAARTSINAMNRQRSTGFSIRYEYFEVFAGFSIEAPKSTIDQIAAMSGVYMITDIGTSQMDYIADPDYTTDGNRNAREIMEIADLHAAGIDGSGVKVGVIDSGIDATHPDLVDAYKGGYNFADKTADMTLQDGDHGTHVSGTIASQGIESLGVAPGVDLYMGQVFSTTSSNSASNDDVTAAIEAFCAGDEAKGIPKVDVINMSLGNNVNTAYYADRYVRNNAVVAGVILVCSAGNNAYPDNNTTVRNNYTLGSGSVSLPISVAASQYGGVETYQYTAEVTDVSGSDSLPIYAENFDRSASLFQDGVFGNNLTYVEGKGYAIYVCMNSVPAAGAQATTLATLQAILDDSLEGKILVVGRGIDFYAYKEHALRTGAGGLIIVNREDEWITNMNIGSETGASDLVIFSAKVSSAQMLLDLEGEAYLDPGMCISENLPMEPAPFSSIGPVNETAEIKPDIIAPGYSILSTSLDGTYAAMSGTSMSSPWVAGVAALIKQQYPDATNAEVKARLTNTADRELIKPLSTNLAESNGTYFNAAGTETSVYEQGSGFINPKRAIYDNVYILVENEVPTGNTDQSAMSAQLPNFSFGNTEPGTTSKTLTATVNGLDDYAVSVVYNHDTRYSNANEGNVVEVAYTMNPDNTFDVWLEIGEDANDDSAVGGNLYEGYIIVSGGGKDFVLPWATRVGETVMEGENWLLYPDRPIQAAWGHANQDWSTYSARNVYYLWFEGSGIMDKVQLRSTKSGSTYTYYLDILLLRIEEDSTNLAYRYQIGLGTSTDANAQLSDFLLADAYYFLSTGGLGLPSQAYALGADGIWATTQSSIAAGNYQVGLEFESGIDYYYQLGVTITDERPTMTINNAALDEESTALGNVTLTADSNTYGIYDYGEDEYTISGTIYSPAINSAQSANSYGFYWAGYYLFYYDVIIPLDQSLNILEETTVGEALFDNQWICDENGSFSLTFATPENKDNAYLFNYNYNSSTGEITWTPDGSRHSVRAADAFDVTMLGTNYGFYTYGALASYSWTPYVREASQEIAVESVKINASAMTNISVGTVLELTLAINPEGASNAVITWSSSNTNILTVDENGVVTAIKAGSARITVTSENGKTDVITIRVTG